MTPFIIPFIWRLDLSGSARTMGGIGGLLMIQDNGHTYFPAYDGGGNVVALMDAANNGSLAATYEYTPFGQLLRKEGSYAGSNPFRFSTKWWDEETGDAYYGARYYSPRLGRFLNQDPIQEKGGINLYGFCGNDAINRFDVNGNSWLSKLWDRTILSLGRKIAINWDHQGRTAVEMIGVVVASYFGGEALASAIYAPAGASVAATTSADIAAGQMGVMTVTADSGFLSGAVASGAISAGTATTIAVTAGGAAGGFIGGTMSGVFAGENFSQTMQGAFTGAGEAAAFAFAGAELLNARPVAPSWSGAEGAVVTSAARYGVNAFAERNLGINGWEFDAGLEAVSYAGYKLFGDPYSDTYSGTGNNKGVFSYIGGFGDRDPATGWLFANNPTAHYWGEFLFDANDQLLQWQGLPDAGGIKYAYHGLDLPNYGDSLGASRLVTLASLGLINGGSAIALPFGISAGTGVQAYLGWLDPIANPLNFLFNPEASISNNGHPLGSYVGKNPGL